MGLQKILQVGVVNRFGIIGKVDGTEPLKSPNDSVPESFKGDYLQLFHSRWA